MRRSLRNDIAWTASIVEAKNTTAREWYTGFGFQHFDTVDAAELPSIRDVFQARGGFSDWPATIWSNNEERGGIQLRRMILGAVSGSF